VTICLLLFAGGLIAVWLGKIEGAPFWTVTGAVGSVASIFGLIGLAQSNKPTVSLDQISSSAANEIASRITELREKTDAVNEAKGQVAALEQRRSELETLIRRTSLVVALETNLAFMEQRLEHISKAQPELADLVERIGVVTGQLKELNAEIKRSPYAENVERVLRDARGRIADRRSRNDPLDILATAMVEGVSQVLRMYKSLFRL